MAEHRNGIWAWWEDYGAGITSAQDHRLAQVPSVDSALSVGPTRR